MKVAIIRRSFRIDGGAERAVSNYIDAYLNAGCLVTVICEHWPNNKDSRFEVIPIKLWGDRVLKLWLFWFRVKQILKASEFDVIQSHEWIPGANILRLGDGLHADWYSIASQEKTKVLAFFWQWSLFHRSKIWMEYTALRSPSVSKIIVNSEMIGDRLRFHHPNLKSQILLQRNVINDSFFKPKRLNMEGEIHDCLSILFVGSGWYRKGLVSLLRALFSIKRDLLFTLDIYGTDKREKYFKDLVASEGLSHAIKFRGVHKLDEDHYRGKHVLVIPSFYDPFPNVIAEALSSGVRVITSENTGAVDFADTEAVTVVKNHAELVNALLECPKTSLADELTRKFRVFFASESFYKQVSRDLLS